MNYQLLANRAEDFVRKYMYEHDNPALLYHNLPHAQNIVSVTSQIAKHYEVNDKDFFIVIAAGWFLNSGYYEDISEPEKEGIKIAEAFFKNAEIEEDAVQAVKKCILATRTPGAHQTILEQIVCDADSFYLGTEDFPKYNRLRRKELELLNNIYIDKDNWRKRTIKLFEGHEYYTDYCKEHLNKNKVKNLQQLKKKDLLQTLSVNPITKLVNAPADTIEKSEPNKKSKVESPERTIETMLRTTSANSQRLSNQADSKAHILISVNAIIISLLLSVVVRKMDGYSWLTIPVLLLLFVNLTTIIFSILATKPNIPKGVFSQDDLKQHKVNLLFFGNFFKMNFDEYARSMLQVMGDRQFLYLSMLRNLHEQGIVLAKKYRMLKTAYSVFMYGLVGSVIAFLIASGYF
ncbi:MAG: Pycsar system effector family protein [Ferruginibacter sp.]